MINHVPKVIFALVMGIAVYVSAETGPRFVKNDTVTVWYEGVSETDARKCLNKASEICTASEEKLNVQLRLTRRPNGLRLSFEKLNTANIRDAHIEWFREFATVLAEAMQVRENVEIELSGNGSSRIIGTVPDAGTPAEVSSESVSSL